MHKVPCGYVDPKHKYYLGIAKAAAQLSKDDKAKIAAVALSKNRVVSIGVNGYPAGYDDSDKDHKHDKMVHAELNAIFNYGGNPKDIDTMYIYGLPPCVDCIKAMAAVGIRKIVFQINSNIRSRFEWLDEFNRAKRSHEVITFINITEDN